MNKKMFVALVMAVALVVAFAGIAFATWADSTYISWTPAVGGTGDTTGNPHVYYQSNSTKCAVCHAVHNAGKTADADRLLPDDTANACNFCHVSLTSSIVTVYRGLVANYTNAYDTAHSNTGVGGKTGTVGCADCHTVHGAGTVTIGGEARNLKDLTTTGDSYVASGNVGVGAGAGRTAYPAAYSVQGVTLTSVSEWCSGCHPYLNRGLNGRSHIMTSSGGNLTDYVTSGGASIQAAWRASDDCSDCHDSATSTKGTAPVKSGVAFPHYTDGARFLSVAATSGAATTAAGDGTFDGVCLKCHANSTAAGVGGGF